MFYNNVDPHNHNYIVDSLVGTGEWIGNRITWNSDNEPSKLPHSTQDLRKRGCKCGHCRLNWPTTCLVRNLTDGEISHVEERNRIELRNYNNIGFSTVPSLM